MQQPTKPKAAKACQPIVGFTTTLLQTERNDFTAILGVICGQHVEYPSHYWLYRLVLLLPKFLVMLGWHQANTLAENPPPPGSNQRRFP